jgi:hypothetical protein
VIRVLGLQPLAKTPLPPGRREIRIRRGGGLSAEEVLLRILAGPRGVEAQSLIFWPTDRMLDLNTECSDGVRVRPCPDSEKPSKGYSAVVRKSLAGKCHPFKASESG